MNNPQLACARLRRTSCSRAYDIAFPLVSVIIPAYNAEVFIEKTLKSVLSQTYKNIEVIVIDDGSEDQTVDLVRKIMQQDQRVILLQQVNSGVAAARNLGIEKAKGEFIAPIDADDLWYAENLEKQMQSLLNSDSSVGLTYAWSLDIDENDFPSGEFRSSTLEGNVYTILLLHYFLANASSTVIRRSVLEKVGYYNENLRIQNAQGCEDWELYLRIAERYKFRVVPEFLIGYRKVSNSMSSDGETMAKSLIEIWKSVFCKYPKIPKTIYRLSLSSFYMYLARQNYYQKSSEKTLVWLYRALKVDCVTPFLRLGLYKMLIKSCYFISIKKLSQVKNLEQFFFKTSKPRRRTKDKSSKSIAKIGFKSWLEKILHQIVLLLFSSPNHWKESEKSDLYLKLLEK
ncbi:glycosyltransferase [Chroococcus sp. FPU101]|uniref:glycosyltransferase family 2 protein n=1 Tax=Chroococcus sp. FPU101 TaxID=1974212 RepID=UPI001AA402D5|nr:glycosyltransferase [Chroococcus sp. FPU101]GFE71017.1 glycosyl transferase family 2 [Chroococcus sp. FPU101]